MGGETRTGEAGRTWEEVETFFIDQKGHYEKEIENVIQILEKLKSSFSVPIYAIKYRVKSLESIYLKMKKDKKHIKEISDIAGIRILCLFETDIVIVHKEIILALLNDDRYTLESFKIYNWDIENDKKFFKDFVAKVGVLPEKKIIDENKGSGYKSLHYIYSTRSGYKLEIQLRTLMQDVWGEIEHTISYKKGYVHPHIQQSFLLMSKDLNRIDKLVSHLRSISNCEECGKTISRNIGPYSYFDYQEEIIPNILKSGKNRVSFDNYINKMKSVNLRNQNPKSKLDECKSEFESLINNIDQDAIKNDMNLSYFIDMERAFFYFCEGIHSEAEEIYKRYQTIEKNFSDETKHFILHFRLGELHYILGKTEESLKEFDKCNNILNAYPDGYADRESIYRVKTKMAMIYWILGEDYNDISIELITDAEKALKLSGFEGEKKAKEEMRLENNKAWYNSIRYFNDFLKYDNYKRSKEKKSLTKKEKSEIAILKNKYEESRDKVYGIIENLKNYLTSEYSCFVSSNILDTIAWFYYCEYVNVENSCIENAKEYSNRLLGNNSQTLIEDAKKYAKQLLEKNINDSTLALWSGDIHRRHIEEIFCAKDAADRLFTDSHTSDK
jgi:ppGpp synthetase/RelA/SpoT-type nucleotidyltranferase